MENRQFELCLEVLRRFEKEGLLDKIILIGSWCLFFYQHYFKGKEGPRFSSFKTRDIDFLIDKPSRIKKHIDVPELLKDLGFVVQFRGNKGYLKLDHPELILEFLVPEKGKGSDKPYPLPNLGMNAIPLRYLSFLSQDTIRVDYQGIAVTLPHPANFALHKLIIFQRRAKKEKAEKDKKGAIDVLRALIETGEKASIIKSYNSIPEKWQKKIMKGLKETEENEIIALLAPDGNQSRL